MKFAILKNYQALSWMLALAALALPLTFMEAQSAGQQTDPGSQVQVFETPQGAADALIVAASKFDVPELKKIFGAEGSKIVLTGEEGLDRELSVQFTAKAREKDAVVFDAKNHRRAVLTVGKDDWPFPAPIVRTTKGWAFDAKAGQREIQYRRVGQNELDAIQICNGYVEAQQEYALAPRQGYDANQYAQRIIASPGKQDGLAWQNADGSWDGPLGENVASAIANGFSLHNSYHGYYFKVLKAQGPAAPLGEMDFVVKGLMIGGFALVAAPADYRVTGVKSFIVGSKGVVYQKDLGPNTLEEFQKLEAFNPDKTWQAVRYP
ncbi:MAG: DUF2950 domain-containing protein [Terriglobales bacterium]|jgi:hypothetical protein